MASADRQIHSPEQIVEAGAAAERVVSGVVIRSKNAFRSSMARSK